MVSQVQGLWVQNNAEAKLAFEITVLEIIERAKSGGEIVDWNEGEANVREEVLRRNAKAGYCNRDGSPTGSTKIMSRGIGQSKLNIWPRHPMTGELIDD